MAKRRDGSDGTLKTLADLQADLEALLIIEARTQVWEQSTLWQWLRKAAEDLIKIPAKEGHQQAPANVTIIHKNNRKVSSMRLWPFEVIETLESHHGSHALARWRQSSVQEKVTALPPQIKLAWAADRDGNPRVDRHTATAQTEQQKDETVSTKTEKKAKQPKSVYFLPCAIKAESSS